MVFSKKQTEQAIDVIKLVNDIFYQGIDEGASDIHIEPQRDKVIVRYRIDGILRIIFEGELSIFEHMSSRIKILAGLEMTGLPKPQEGNIKFEHGERFVDLRISVLPTSVGDSIVIRILESNKNFGDYNKLGLTPEQEKILNTVTRKPHGLLLVTGPNASGAIVRLINMGIEPFLLASALKCVTAQRLARLNCPECREQYEPSKELIKLLNAPRDMKFFHSLGCEKCNQRGMIGRKGIHEIIQITRPIQDLILKKPTDEDISELAIKEGMITLRQAALQKVNKGLISIEEAIRLTEQ